MPNSQNKRQELRKTLKRKAIHRVLSNLSDDNIHDIISQNTMFARMKNMRDLPTNHKEELSLIRNRFNMYGKEPRSVMCLNLIARMAGYNTTWTMIHDHDDVPDHMLQLLHLKPPTNAIN